MDGLKVVMVCSCRVCVAGADEVLDELRPIVRHSSGTVLIRAVSFCAAGDCSHSGVGAMLRLQACTDTLRPTAPPTLLGPLRGWDLDVVTKWLQER